MSWVVVRGVDVFWNSCQGVVVLIPPCVGWTTYFRTVTDVERGYPVILYALVSISGLVEWFQYTFCLCVWYYVGLS